MSDTALARSPRPTPLFVFGVARSGTSYFHHLLAAHPQVRLSYEARLVKEGEYFYRRVRDPLDRGQFFELLERMADCETAEPQNRWLVESIRRHSEELYVEHSRAPSFAALMEAVYMKPVPVACWGNKMLRVEMCPDMLRFWPDAKVVILVRDPRAVYASQARLFNTRIKYSAIYWNTHSRWTRTRALDSNRYVVIKYEDFVEHPRQWLERVFEMVGLSDRAATDPILEARPPRTDSLAKWRALLDAEQALTIERLCFDEMTHWGYKPERAASGVRTGRIAEAVETVRQYASEVPFDIAWWRRKQVVKRLLRTLKR